MLDLASSHDRFLEVEFPGLFNSIFFLCLAFPPIFKHHSLFMLRHYRRRSCNGPRVDASSLATGVEAVSADYSNSKLTAVGKVDPLELRERVESKIRRKVVLVSPNVPKKNTPAKDKMADDSKPKAVFIRTSPLVPSPCRLLCSASDLVRQFFRKIAQPASSTVVLKIRLHCGGCIQRIRKRITKIKGESPLNPFFPLQPLRFCFE